MTNTPFQSGDQYCSFYTPAAGRDMMICRCFQDTMIDAVTIRLHTALGSSGSRQLRLYIAMTGVTAAPAATVVHQWSCWYNIYGLLVW
jgi:hypothetical protein